jgi:biopolymer transport protein ExbB
MGIIKGISDAFQKGGWGMWPILAASIFVVGLIIERTLFLFRAAIDKNKFVPALQKLILQGNVAQAIKFCSGANVPLANVVKAGLLKVNKSDQEVQAAMDEAALRELPKIEKRTGYLAMLGNIATLMGLLGTVTGLIKSFGAVAGVDPSKKAEMLAEGISEAMNCTAFGLLVGIISLIAFSILNGKTQHILDDINEVTVQVLNLVTGNRNAMNTKAVAA